MSGNEFGQAGRGLYGDGAVQKFGKGAVEAGASGERYMRQAMERAGLMNGYTVFHSVRVPDDPANPGRNRAQSDIDHVIISGNNILLIDTKRWAANNMYWSIMGKPFKGMKPMKKGNGDWRMSRNMEWALSRVRANVPNANVKAIVVFVPSNKKGALPTSVGLLRWPGGIRSFLVGDGLQHAKRFLGEPKPASKRSLATFSAASKRYS